jgi:hypothetical protein
MDSVELCSFANVLEGLYATQAEVRQVVCAWKLLQELGISYYENPLSGAIVAKMGCNGGMDLLRVEGCEVQLFGTSRQPCNSSRYRIQK